MLLTGKSKSCAVLAVERSEHELHPPSRTRAVIGRRVRGATIPHPDAVSALMRGAGQHPRRCSGPRPLHDPDGSLPVVSEREMMGEEDAPSLSLPVRP